MARCDQCNQVYIDQCTHNVMCGLEHVVIADNHDRLTNTVGMKVEQHVCPLDIVVDGSITVV